MESNQQFNSVNSSQEYVVVIIEDDEGIGRLIQKELKRHDFKTSLAQSGKEALKIVSGRKNEILLLDYKLPDMTGKELLQKLIKKHDHTPDFITMTGYGNEKVAAEMMKMGSREYIVKEPDFLDALPEVLKFVCKNIEKERKLSATEASLDENLKLLKETGEMARVGGWEIDLETNKVIWTNTTKKIHEVPADYKPSLEEGIDFFPEKSKEQIQKAVDKAIHDGVGYELELRFITAKGNKLWVHTIANPEIKNGKCVRIRGTFQDITRRKEAEIELKTKNLILNRTEEIAHVGSWEWDAASDTVTWSDELFRIFRLNPENGAISYTDHPKIYTPESMQKLDNAVQQCLKNGTSYQLDLEIIRGDGTHSFCTSRGFAEKDESGKVVRLFGSFQDITERKKDEENLRALNEQLSTREKQLNKKVNQLNAANQQLSANDQQLRAANQQLTALNQQLISSEHQLKVSNEQLTAIEQQLRAINQQLTANEKELIKSKELAERYLNVAAAIIVSLDYKGNITLLNENGHQLLGYEKGQLIGKNWFETCLPEKDVKEIKNVFKQIKNGQIENVKNYESDIQTKYGETKTILWHNTILKDENGKITGTLSSGEDITIRKKAEEERRKSDERFRIAQEMSPDGFTIFKPVRNDLNRIIDFVWIYQNAAVARMNGTDPQKVVGQSFLKLFPGMKGTQFWKAYIQVAESGKPMTFENAYAGETMKKNTWFRIVVVPMEENIAILAQDITERKTAEFDIRASKDYLNSILRAAPVGIGVVSNRILTHINSTITEMTGYKQEELVGKDALVLYPDKKEYEYVGKEKYKQISKAGTGSLETRWKCKNGKIIDVLLSSTPIDLNDLTKGVTFSALDITERKKANKELQKAKRKAEISEERFRKSQEAGKIGSWEFNPQTNEFWGSDEARRIYNLELDNKEFPAEEVMNIVAEKDREKVNQAMIDLLNAHKTYDIIFEITPKGTSEKKTIHSVAELQRDKKGNPLKVSGILHDITLRKALEQKIKEAREKAEKNEANIKAIIEGTNNSIWAFNRNYEILYLNHTFQQEFLQSFGVDLKPGMNLLKALPEPLQPVWKQRYDRALANEQYELEDAVPTEKGTLYIQVAFNPIVKNGQVIGGSCIGNDITSRKLKEKELIRAKEKAEESDLLKSAFLANMSHEIRTPMNGILGFTSLLQNPELTSKQQEKFIEIIRRSGNRMLDTVNALIDISKIETGQMSISLTEVNINNELKTLYDFFNAEAGQKGLELKLEKLPETRYGKQTTDQQKFISVFTNLIKNAIKYTDEGTISFGCKVEKGQLTGYVSDTGIGVPSERREAIFNRFEQADIKDTRAFQGSGLGLAISKAYVEMLGGEIWVESVEGEGSTFFFTLPVQEQAPQKNQETEEKKTATSKQTYSDQKLKILIAEDDEDSIAYLKAVLVRQNVELYYAFTGKEVIEQAKKYKSLDLILMDIKLPVMDGYDATRKIREFNKEVKIIAQTAYALEGDRAKALEAGCDDYISKPIDKSILMKKMEEIKK